MITVLYFAACRERAGTDEEKLPLEGLRVSEAKEQIFKRHPNLSAIANHIRFARNQDFGDDDDVLEAGDELALIPPVAGGNVREPLVRVGDAALDMAPLLNNIRHDAAGAEVTMTGRVRNHAAGETVVKLRYEAYAAMAEKIISKILQETEDTFPDVRAACSHRIGDLAIGDAAVIVCCSSPHRAEAFEACQRIIDRLKEDAPIWKHEHRASGEVWVGLGP